MPFDVYGHESAPHSQEDTFAAPSSSSAAGGQRYYFDVYDGERRIQDEEGLYLEGPDKAKAQAMTALADMARIAVPEEDRREFVVEIRDETGRKFWRARLTLVIEVPSDP